MVPTYLKLQAALNNEYNQHSVIQNLFPTGRKTVQIFKSESLSLFSF